MYCPDNLVQLILDQQCFLADRGGRNLIMFTETYNISGLRTVSDAICSLWDTSLRYVYLFDSNLSYSLSIKLAAFKMNQRVLMWFCASLVALTHT